MIALCLAAAGCDAPAPPEQRAPAAADDGVDAKAVRSAVPAGKSVAPTVRLREDPEFRGSTRVGGLSWRPSGSKNRVGPRVDPLRMDRDGKTRLKVAALAGTTLTFDTTKFPVQAPGASIEIDLTALLARATWRRSKTGAAVSWTADFEMSIAGADGQQTRYDASLDATFLLRGKLGALDFKGFTFAWEGAPPKKREAAWVALHGGGAGFAVGEVSTVTDVDVVATVKNGGKRQTTCGPYAGGGKTVTKKVSLVTKEVTVFDRRTGERLGKKTIHPDFKCPKRVWADAVLSAYVDGSKTTGGALSNWVGGFLEG